MDEEVADVDDDRVSVRHIRSVIPPLAEPAEGLGSSSAVLEPLLEFAGKGRGEEGGDGGLCFGVGLLGEQGLDGLEVFAAGGLESGDG